MKSTAGYNKPGDETVEDEASTQEVKKPCRRAKDIVVDWPAPPVAFKELNPLNEDEEFALLMIPWGGGRQLIYSVDDQNTYFESLPPAWWLYPNTSAHLYGEEYRPDMTRIGYGIRRLLNSNPSLPGWQIPDPLWLINDIYQPDLNAMQRSYNMTNLGPQPEGVGIAPVYQANSPETFNKYLEHFKTSGFIGALVRPLSHMVGDPDYVALKPIAE